MTIFVATNKMKKMNTVENLEWRYATKKFDNKKKVDGKDLETLKEAISLSATSYGLQLYKVLVIEDEATKAKLLPASWGQAQIVDASQVIVFCNYTEVKPEQVDSYLKLKADKQGIPFENLAGYGDFMKSKLAEMTKEEMGVWTSKQVYIALANLMTAAAELKIDSCPMEGFDASQYNEILGLNEKGLTAAVVAPIGYRSAEDGTQNMPKVRKDKTELFEMI